MDYWHPDSCLERLRKCANDLLNIIERFRLANATCIPRGSDAAQQIWRAVESPLLDLRLEIERLPKKSRGDGGPSIFPAVPALTGDMVRDAEISAAVSLLDTFEEVAIGWRSHDDKEHFGIWTIPAAAVEQLREAVRLIGEPAADNEAEEVPKKEEPGGPSRGAIPPNGEKSFNDVVTAKRPRLLYEKLKKHAGYPVDWSDLPTDAFRDPNNVHDEMIFDGLKDLRDELNRHNGTFGTLSISRKDRTATLSIPPQK